MSDGGDPACWLSQVCMECGKFRENRYAAVCEFCGTPVEGEDGDQDTGSDASRDADRDRERERGRERDRDDRGRARSARPRDALGRPLPHGAQGVERQPEGVPRTPAETLTEAQRLLDEGLPFHAHEVLEDAWKSSPEPERALWRGLAQLAVGLTHTARGNVAGAAALLGRAGEGIAVYAQDAPYGIAAAELSAWARETARGMVAGAGAERVPPRLTR